MSSLDDPLLGYQTAEVGGLKQRKVHLVNPHRPVVACGSYPGARIELVPGPVTCIRCQMWAAKRIKNGNPTV